MKSQVQAAPRVRYADGSIVLARIGWNHEEKGRPFVVLFTRDQGIRLCPLTSKDSGRGDQPIQARPGGLRFNSWIAAVNRYWSKIQMFWAQPQQILSKVGQLNATELAAVKLTAAAQVRTYNSQRLVR